MTLPSILSTRLPYNELLSRLEEYVRMKEREAAERAAIEMFLRDYKYQGKPLSEVLSIILKQYEK